MYSFPFPLSSLARVLFLPANRKTRQGKRNANRFSSLLVLVIVDCNANRKLYFLSLSLFDNCTTIEKMLEHWTNIFNGIAKGSKRNFLLCKWILGDRDSKCQFQIVSRRSKARQGGVFRIESVFSIFHSFLIPSIIFPVSSHRWMYT